MSHSTYAKELLAGQLTAVRGELSRVDAKCSTLVSLAGAALAFLVTQVHGPLAVRVLLSVAGVILAAATIVLLLVLRPRLGSTGFRRYAAMPPEQIKATFTSYRPYDPDAPAKSNGANLAGIECEDLHVLSAIVNRKYLGLRLAVDLVAAGVALVAIALVAAAF